MKKNTKVATTIITTLITILLSVQISFAQIFSSTGATSNSQSNIIHILITNVSFANDTQDFFKIIGWQNNNSPINLNGFTIYVDGKLYEFKENFFLQPYQELTFTFKNEALAQKSNVIELTNAGLTATTETLSVKDKNGVILDAVCWQSSTPAQSELKEIEAFVKNSAWSGSCFDSELVAKNDEIKRKQSLQDTNKKTDWELVKSAQVNPASSSTNSSTSPNSASTANSSSTSNSTSTTVINSSGDLLAPSISEIFPNPKGADEGLEWIEIYNPNNQDINLTDWSIVTSSNKKISLNEITLKASEYFILNKEHKVSLKNTNETLSLINPNKEVVETVSYDKAPDDQSYNKIDNEWLWSTNVTPLEDNEVFQNNSAATIGGSNSSGSSSSGFNTNLEGQLSNSIIITEILANPEGTDTGKEWVELFNASSEDVSLNNWLISNSSKENRLGDNVTITAQSYIILTNEILGFTFKNSNEQISLLDFNGKIIDLVEYASSKESLSYSLTINSDTQEQMWLWVAPTPGEANLQTHNLEVTIKSFNEQEGILQIEGVGATSLISILIDQKNDIDTQAFVEGAKIQMTVFEDKDHQYHIQELKNLKPPQSDADTLATQNPNSSKIRGISYFVLIILSIIFLTKLYDKSLPWWQVYMERRHFKKRSFKILAKI